MTWHTPSQALPEDLAPNRDVIPVVAQIGTDLYRLLRFAQFTPDHQRTGRYLWSIPGEITRWRFAEGENDKKI